MSTVRLAIIAAISALSICGCTPQIRSAPPSAGLDLFAGPGASMTSGQAVWIDNRILTAAHVLVPDYEDPALVTEFLLNGEPVRVLGAVSGDLDAVARLYSEPDPQRLPPNPSEWFHDWLEDWVVAEVSRSAPTQISLRVCDRPVRPGDRLYAVGFPPEEDEPRLRALPLTVLRLSVEADGQEEDRPPTAMERMIAVRSPTRHDLRGWSGSFVGRYDARSDQWGYIGLLIFGADGEDGKRADFVLRPPPEALRLLMQDD